MTTFELIGKLVTLTDLPVFGFEKGNFGHFGSFWPVLGHFERPLDPPSGVNLAGFGLSEFDPRGSNLGDYRG